MVDYGVGCVKVGECSTSVWLRLGDAFFHARLRGGLHPGDAFFHARLRVRLLEVKKSSKKSVFGENRLAVRVFEGKKSSIESSMATP